MIGGANAGRGDGHRLIDAAAVVLVFWIFAWTLAKIATPLSPPPLPGERWGNTSFSDFLTLMAGERFHTEGYVRNYLLDNMTVGLKEFSRGWYAYQVPHTAPNSAVYYTHYGSLDGIVNGFLRGLGVADLLTFYKIAAFLSCGSLLLWYAMAAMVYGRAVGFISLFFLGTSLIFLRLAETIAAYSYDFLFAFGAGALFVASGREGVSVWRARLALAGSWLLTFLQASNSPEFVLWLQIFFMGYLWVDRSRRGRGAAWVALAMTAAPIAAYGIHFFQMAWALGGVGNAVRDLGDALSRRTTGFALATETPFRSFRLERALPFINRQLMTMLRFNLVGAALLLVLVRWCTLQLRRRATERERKALSVRWAMAITLLLAGAAFWFALPQATVTATEITLRLFLPFAGVLIGYTLVLLWGTLRQSDVPPLPKLIALGVTAVVVAPVAIDRFAGRATDLNLHVAAPAYTGRTTNEIRILANFVRDGTRYGDIVLTPIDVGDTGHPWYPHPAYEYLSQRRFEVVRSVAELGEAIARLEMVRRRQADWSPAGHVSYYLLLDDTHDFSEFRSFAACSHGTASAAGTRAWWVDHRGGVPVLPGGRGERDVVFSMFRLPPDTSTRCVEEAGGHATRKTVGHLPGPE